MKTDSLKKAILFLTAALVLLLPFCSYAESRKIDMSINYGIDSHAKGGRYLPVDIEYTNLTPAAFDGSVDIFCKDNDDETYQYTYAVKIDGQTVSRKRYYIPIGVRANALRTVLRDSTGGEVSEKDINLSIDTSSAQLFIGVLSDHPDKLEYFNDRYIDYGLLHTQTFALDVEQFPENVKGLDQFDIILISDFRIRDLSEAQSHALMEWVKSGGVMMLGTGERADDTLGRFAPELLDDMYEEPEMHQVNLGNGITLESPDEGIRELCLIYAPIHGGNVVIPGDSFALVSSVNKDNGLIVIAAYDFTDVSDFAGEHKDFADNLISKALGSKRVGELAGEMYGNDSDKLSRVQLLINTGDADRLPPLKFFAFSIFAYILLAGPGLYLFLKSRDAGKYYRSGVILLALAFTVVIYLMGSKTRFVDTFYNYATIQDADEDTVNDTTFINLRNPYNRSYEVKLDSAYTVRPVTEVATAYYNMQDELSAEPIVRVSYAEGNTGIGIGKVGAFIPSYFELEKTEENKGNIGFTGNIYLFKDEVFGSISNNFDYDVANAAILFYGRMILIGDMKAGETKELEGSDIINIPVAQSRQVADVISGFDEFDGDSSLGSEYLSALEKSNILAFYRDFYMNGYTADARVLAFSKIPMKRDIVRGNLTGYGITMLTSRLSVDSRNEDWELYRSAIIKNPVVISGQYEPDDNTVITTQPCVLEYQLGSDLDISEMIYEWPQIGDTFSGIVSWYNYSTGSYDPIDMEKTEYTAEEMEGYLSPSNTIRMRYTYRGEVSGEVSLPMISIVGIER